MMGLTLSSGVSTQMLANYIKKRNPNVSTTPFCRGVIRIRERERENKVDTEEEEDERKEKEYIKNSAVQDYAAKVRNQVV